MKSWADNSIDEDEEICNWEYDGSNYHVSSCSLAAKVTSSICDSSDVAEDAVSKYKVHEACAPDTGLTSKEYLIESMFSKNNSITNH